MAATVGEWTYKVAPGALAAGRYANQIFNGGYSRAQLFQDGDMFTFRLQGPAVDDCFTKELPAVVERSEQQTTITPEPYMAACPKIRLVINNDGSGGVVQLRVGRKGAESWQTDEEHQYGLTPR